MTDDRYTAASYPVFKAQRLVAFMSAEEDIRPEQILCGTGITEQALKADTSHISLAQLEQVFCNMVKHCGDPTLALRAGQQIHMMNYGIYGFALLSSVSLRDAILFSIKYHQLASPTATMRLEEDDEGFAHFSIEHALPTDTMRLFNTDFQISIVYSLIKELTALDFKLHTVCIEHEAPAHQDYYRQLFEAQVQFDCERTELVFRADMLEKPLSRSNLVTNKMMRSLCDKALAELTNTDSFISELQGFIMSEPRAMESAEYVSEKLGMTSRTLRRKLAARNTSFRELVASVRKTLAIEYLSTSMSTEEIASRLAYGDAAAFRHAFKRWTGHAPNRYRTRQ